MEKNKKKGSWAAVVSRIVVSRPGWVILGTLVLCILSAWAAGNIETKTKIQDMLPGDNPQVITYTEIDELFSGGSSAIIVLEGEDREAIIAAADDLILSLHANGTLMNLSRAVEYGLERDFVADWGMVLQTADDLERSANLYKRTDLLSYFTALNDSVEEAWTGDNPDEEIETFRQEADAAGWLNQMDLGLSLMEDLLAGEAEDTEATGRELADILTFGDLKGFNDAQDMLLVTVLPNFNIVDMEKIHLFMSELQAVLEDVGNRHPQVALSYTGDVPIQADEQDALNFDMLVPALVALVLISVLFIISLPRLSTIIHIVLALVAGIILTYGFLGITIRVVNMLTSVMAVLLVGLGVDYGIQFSANYHLFRRRGEPVDGAMARTFERAGSGIAMAALTTSVAFFVMALTGSMAFRQFGFVLGSGILFCLVSMTTFLPALLVITDRRTEKRRMRREAKGRPLRRSGSGHRVLEYGFLQYAANGIGRRPTGWLIGAAVLTVGLLASALFSLKVDYDLMAMEPQTMPSIIAYRKVMESYGITPFQSMVVAEDVEDARRLADVLESRKQVADVASISYLIPSDEEQRASLEAIAALRDTGPRYIPVEWTEERVAELAGQLQRLEWNAIEMADLSVAGLGDGNRIQEKRNDMIREILGAETGEAGREVFQRLITRLESDPGSAAAGLARLDTAFGPAFAAIADRMAAADRPLTLEDVPEPIRQKFFTDSGERNLIYVYPKEGMMENSETIRRFSADLAEVDPGITGSAQIVVAWFDDTIRATVLSAIFIFITVVIFLFVMMRRLNDVVRAVVPLVTGIVWMLGFYALAGLELNFMNIAVIPLVIGMGIDFGIHLAHRYRVEQDIAETYRTTGKAVFLSGATTLIGFGSLGLIGRFPSIASMGSILAFGIGSCLLAAFLVLPSLLGRTKDTAIPSGGKDK